MNRYVGEPGSDALRRELATAATWFIVRIGYVETVRAIALAAAALVLPVDDLSFATWDDRLHAAAREEGLHLLPERLG